MKPDTFLFTDTESTKFPRKGGAQEGQARVCQLAFIYTDDAGNTLAEFCALIKPDGWEIGEDAGKIHGITLEECEAHGIPSTQALALFRHFEKMATKVIAHGEQFDRQMIDIEQAYASNNGDLPREPWHCTMKSYTHYFAGKWPKLAQALEFFTGRILGDDAHDAMHDVRACRDIFFAARTKEATNGEL